MADGMDKWDYDPTQRMDHVFKKDARGLYIPELSDPIKYGWVASEAGLMTIKLTGDLIKAVPKGNAEMELTRIKRYAVDKDKFTLQKLDAHYPEDRGPLHAWKHMDDYQGSGYYCAYGPDIKGNPHGLDQVMIVRVFPVSYKLMVTQYAQKDCKIVRFQGVQRLFETLEAELRESPEIEGIVFHKEQQQNPMMAVQVEKRGFGIAWPPLQTPKPQEKKVDSVLIVE